METLENRVTRAKLSCSLNVEISTSTKWSFQIPGPVSNVLPQWCDYVLSLCFYSPVSMTATIRLCFQYSKIQAKATLEKKTLSYRVRHHFETVKH